MFNLNIYSIWAVDIIAVKHTLGHSHLRYLGRGYAPCPKYIIDQNIEHIRHDYSTATCHVRLQRC